MKGIILAAGVGTRLYPLTNIVSKQLLPVYDKPMIYYPLSLLLYAGIREILIISTPRDLPSFKKLFEDGSSIGVKFYYKEQPAPEGIAQAFILGEDFIGKDSVCLILGDNIFYGETFFEKLPEYTKLKKGAIIFGYPVKNPERYGVVEFDDRGNVISIEEKPQKPKSNYAVTGLYFYDNKVIEIAKKLKPSCRGELEITDVNKKYLEKDELKVVLLGRGSAWLDTGTYDSLLDAANFIATVERRQGLKIGCIEEIALNKGYIDIKKFLSIIELMPENSYKEYLKTVLKEYKKKK